jgi:choline dehydrogenase
MPGMTASVYQMRPESRGVVELASPDPTAPPRIQPNYLHHEADRRSVVAGLRLLRGVFAQEAFAPFLGEELSPGAEVQSNEALLEYARATGSTLYHASGTCRMGSDDEAVVDPSLRVRGFEGLRVVDASVMPLVVSANTNAATIMIAEKASDLVRAVA